MSGLLAVLGEWAWNQTMGVWNTFTAMGGAPLLGLPALFGFAGRLMSRLACCGGRMLRVAALTAATFLWALGVVASLAWMWTMLLSRIPWLLPLVGSLGSL